MYKCIVVSLRIVDIIVMAVHDVTFAFETVLVDFRLLPRGVHSGDESG